MIVSVGSRSVTLGKEEEWEALWRRMLELMRDAPGFRSARLLRSTEHNGKYAIVMEWDSREGWDQVYESDAMQRLTTASFALFKGAPVQEWHVVVGEAICPQWSGV